MIFSNCNLFLQITILLIIASFSEEFFVTKNRKKSQSDQELEQKIPREQIYYHRNDIGHLNEYYQERKKLTQEYKAIQKALEVKNLKREKSNSDYHLLETYKSLNTNSLDSFPLKYQDQNFNGTLSINANRTEENSNLTAGIQNTENDSQNKRYVKIGDCRGQIIYNQNILITGANYKATNGYLLEINLEGICITCVEIKSKNDKEVKINVISGGPGKPNMSLNFEELNKNFDFSYALKLWGVGEKC